VCVCVSRIATVERLPRISRGLTDVECCENDTVTFECKLNITRETDVRWKKDGKVFIVFYGFPCHLLRLILPKKCIKSVFFVYIDNKTL